MGQMHDQDSGIDRDYQGQTGRLWSLPAALEHLRAFATDCSGRAGKSATLEVFCPPVLVSQGTVDLLIPTLVQLLRNAIEHSVETPIARLVASKPLTATITADVELGSGRIAVTVGDDGSGIAADRAARVRQSLSARRRRSPGSIGLNTAERSSERPAHGLQRAMARIAPANGEIRFDSQIGQGTSVTVLLDAMTVAPEPRLEAGSTPYAGTLS